MMNYADLGEPVFKASPEKDEGNFTNENSQTMSFESVAKVKVIANRAVARRRSLFDYDSRGIVDSGLSTLSHADFPASPARSRASSVDHSIKEIGFDKELIYGILDQEMTKKLSGKYYDSKECDLFSKQIAGAVKERIDALKIKNFKIVCVCYISKRSTPAMKLESGCAWDELITAVDKDGFVDCVFQNEFISALGTVYGVCCTRVPQTSTTRRSSSFPSRSRGLSVN